MDYAYSLSKPPMLVQASSAWLVHACTGQQTRSRPFFIIMFRPPPGRLSDRGSCQSLRLAALSMEAGVFDLFAACRAACELPSFPYHRSIGHTSTRPRRGPIACFLSTTFSENHMVRFAFSVAIVASAGASRSVRSPQLDFQMLSTSTP